MVAPSIRRRSGLIHSLHRRDEFAFPEPKVMRAMPEPRPTVGARLRFETATAIGQFSLPAECGLYCINISRAICPAQYCVPYIRLFPSRSTTVNRGEQHTYARNL
ncbi:hypothetical protein BVI2075_120103 [Burkholderia vietnamiensis]|nr:hypothetical protein BVI2075_120103 [Burkholderia vietnamiensis]